jgi:hypothetical protein
MLFWKRKWEVIGMRLHDCAATADFGPGFRYVIATVSREGVKKVNGKDLPKE